MHDNFTDEMLEDETLKEMYKNLGPLERVFVQDHDFFCCTRVRNEEVDEYFARGLESYQTGDWIGAQQSFQRCKEIYGREHWQKYGWLTRMIELIDKSKATAPEAWQGAYDWDQKPTPPDFELEGVYGDESSNDSRKK